jgi:hypothetical protein
MQHLPLP